MPSRHDHERPALATRAIPRTTVTPIWSCWVTMELLETSLEATGRPPREREARPHAVLVVRTT